MAMISNPFLYTSNKSKLNAAEQWQNNSSVHSRALTELEIGKPKYLINESMTSNQVHHHLASDFAISKLNPFNTSQKELVKVIHKRQNPFISAHPHRFIYKEEMTRHHNRITALQKQKYLQMYRNRDEEEQFCTNNIRQQGSQDQRIQKRNSKNNQVGPSYHEKLSRIQQILAESENLNRRISKDAQPTNKIFQSNGPINLKNIDYQNKKAQEKSNSSLINNLQGFMQTKSPRQQIENIKLTDSQVYQYKAKPYDNVPSKYNSNQYKRNPYEKDSFKPYKDNEQYDFGRDSNENIKPQLYQTSKFNDNFINKVSQYPNQIIYQGVSYEKINI